MARWGHLVSPRRVAEARLVGVFGACQRHLSGCTRPLPRPEVYGAPSPPRPRSAGEVPYHAMVLVVLYLTVLLEVLNAAVLNVEVLNVAVVRCLPRDGS